MSLTGSRSDGTTVSEPASASGVSTFNVCEPVYKDGAVAGTVTIQLQYVGAGAQVYGSGSSSGAWGSGVTVVTP